LKPEEAALLQGFPDDFDFGKQNSSTTMKQIGNAVQPGVVSVVFEALRKQAKDFKVII
jgi:DNA (cytosine-5)-methyltransferase 1